LDNQINLAYKTAVDFTQSHYENFPVVSFFIPKKLRKHIAVVYQFARQADDLADEKNDKAELRIEQLNRYEEKLKDCINGDFHSDFWIALNQTINQFNLNPKHFFDLLSAFKQDVEKRRYNTFSELLDYCNRSANPVGRILLEFYNIRDEQAIKFSDSLCTALQLTNFYQDLSVDIKKKRIYIPLDEMKKFKVGEKVFELQKNNANFWSLLEYQVNRCRQLFGEGRELLKYLPIGFRIQIKLTINGGLEILQKIEKINYDTLNFRPTINKTDFKKILFKTLLQK
jgi:squalene synthase HpnC